MMIFKQAIFIKMSSKRIFDLPKCIDSNNPQLYYFIKSSIKVLEIGNIPYIKQNYLENDWKRLSSELENQIFCLLIASSYKGNPNEKIRFNEKELKDFLDEKSEKTVIGLSLLSHGCRMSHWTSLKKIISNIPNLKIVNIDEKLKNMVDKACGILSDDRVVNLISRITDFDPFQVRNVVTKREFQIHFVDLDAPFKGWVTPVGIAINIRTLSEIEKTVDIAFARLLGHELTHFINRLNENNFSFSTPEKVRNRKSSSILNLISELKQIHFDIENHLESGLLFDLGFIGEKFSTQDFEDERFQWQELGKYFLDKSTSLPLFNRYENYSNCKILPLNEQFAFEIAEDQAFEI